MEYRGILRILIQTLPVSNPSSTPALVSVARCTAPRPILKSHDQVENKEVRVLKARKCGEMLKLLRQPIQSHSSIYGHVWRMFRNHHTLAYSGECQGQCKSKHAWQMRMASMFEKSQPVSSCNELSDWELGFANWERFTKPLNFPRWLEVILWVNDHAMTVCKWIDTEHFHRAKLRVFSLD